jgi:hypothetical protein
MKILSSLQIFIFVVCMNDALSRDTTGSLLIDRNWHNIAFIDYLKCFKVSSFYINTLC